MRADLSHRQLVAGTASFPSSHVWPPPLPDAPGPAPWEPIPPGMLPSPPGSHAVPCFLDCRSRVYCTENGQYTVLRSVHDQDRFRNHRVEGEMRLCPAPSFCCANELGWLRSHFLIVSIIVRRLEGARFGDRSGTLAFAGVDGPSQIPTAPDAGAGSVREVCAA